MDRDQLAAFIWRRYPARGPQAERAVTAILDAADTYARARARRLHRRYNPPPRPGALRHTSADDLHEVIGVLAGALLGDSEREAA